MSSDAREQHDLRTRLTAALPTLATAPRADAYDVLITGCEINDRHGTGVLLRRVFGEGAGFLSIRSLDLYEGDHAFGDVSVCLPHPSSDAVPGLLSVLDGRVPRRIMCIPYFPDDVRSALAIWARFGSALCTFIMDDQNIATSGIADEDMRSLLTRSDLRLGPSRELCDAYEAKYGLKFWFVPPVAPTEDVLCAPSAGDIEQDRGVMLGNVWSQRWLDRLRATTCDSKVRVDWYGSPRRDWVSFDEGGMEDDGISFRGYLPEPKLIECLRRYPYAVIPTGNGDDPADRPDLARFSLPSRMPYLVAVATTPMIVVGRSDSAAARFVEALGVGVVCPYDSDRLRDAVDHVGRPEVQRRMRARALEARPALSSEGMADWLWTSLDRGEPADARFEKLMPPGRSERSPATVPPRVRMLREADVVITGTEVTDKHGTGALIKRIFGQSANVLSIRSFNQYGGDHDFGDASVHLYQGDASRAEVWQKVQEALQGSTIKRILCVPYFREDFLTAIAVRELSGAPLAAWIMDDQNVRARVVSDDLMREFLGSCSVVFATHPELRPAYERKFGLTCWVLPAVATDRLIDTRPPEITQEATADATGALLGSIWSERWYEMLCRTLQGAGLTLDWYGNAEYYWMRDSRDGCKRKGLVPHGVLREERLAERLRAHSYVVVPTGTLDERDDRPALSELSLPGRILFAVASAQAPVIVLGSRQTSAARFVERFEVGSVCDYDADAFRETVSEVRRADVQRRIRGNAARVARRLSDSGIAEWIWDALEYGRPRDQRFEELMPRGGDAWPPAAESPRG